MVVGKHAIPQSPNNTREILKLISVWTQFYFLPTWPLYPDPFSAFPSSSFPSSTFPFPFAVCTAPRTTGPTPPHRSGPAPSNEMHRSGQKPHHDLRSHFSSHKLLSRGVLAASSQNHRNIEWFGLKGA